LITKLARIVDNFIAVNCQKQSNITQQKEKEMMTELQKDGNYFNHLPRGGNSVSYNCNEKQKCQ